MALTSSYGVCGLIAASGGHDHEPILVAEQQQLVVNGDRPLCLALQRGDNVLAADNILG
jgi:hypothetical protein